MLLRSNRSKGGMGWYEAATFTMVTTSTVNGQWADSNAAPLSNTPLNTQTNVRTVLIHRLMMKDRKEINSVCHWKKKWQNFMR